MLVIVPSNGHAQINADFGSFLIKAFTPPIQVTPALIRVAVTDTFVTIAIANTTEDSIETTLTITGRNQNRSSGVTLGTGKQNSSKGGRMLEESASTMTDSIREDSALVSWIKELPTKVKLAPGEKKSITVKLAIPKSVTPGVYVAWIVVSMPAPLNIKSPTANGGSVVVINEAGRDSTSTSSKTDGKPKMVYASAKLVYHGKAPQ